MRNQIVRAGKRMELVQYDREKHGTLAFDLWQRTVGQQYPLVLEGFLESVKKRASYEDGDGIVAVESGQVIGFGMVEADEFVLAGGYPYL